MKLKTHDYLGIVVTGPMLALIAVCVVVALLYTYREALALVKRQLGEQQLLLARQTTVGIRKNLDLLVREIEWLAQDPAAKALNLPEFRKVAENTYRYVRESFVNDVALLDAEGVVRVPLRAPHLEGWDFSYREYFKKARTSGVSSPVYELITFKGVNAGEKGIAIAMPIFSDHGEFRGVVLFTTIVSELISGLSEHPLAGGASWVIDRHGNVIFHPKYRTGTMLHDVPETDDSFRDLLDMAVAGESGTKEYTSPEGKRMIASCSPIVIAGESWSYVVANDEKVIEDLLVQLAVEYGVLTVTAFLVILIGSTTILWKFSRWNRELESIVRIRTEALEQSKEKLEILVETVNDCIWEVDEGWRYVYVSPRINEILGCQGAELIGQSMFDIVPDQRREATRAAICDGAERGNVGNIEIRAPHRSGRDVVLETGLTPILGEDGTFRGCRGVFRDVTERKRVEKELHRHEEQLQSLAAELLSTEGRERCRIATDLHDRIGQTLAAVRIRLGTARDVVGSSAEVAERLDEARTLIKKTIEETRSLSFELCPPVLSELGFEAAVEWIAEEMEEQHGIVIEIENDGLAKPVDGELRDLLFRAVRELLVNIVKHSGAQSTRIDICRADDTIRVTVEDDGAGFDPLVIGTRWGKEGGFGLFSIRERLAFSGGRLEIESEPGRGTRATLVSPLGSAPGPVDGEA
ncbi:MAG: PAS domain S-box protein [bacterium]|nr:PAS domain S-box protein [bacterium]